MAKRSSTWDSALSGFRPLIIAQGEVSYAYNLLQESFFNAFTFTMAVERPTRFSQQPEFYSYVLELWHVFQNDKLQRQMVLIALGNIPTKLDIKSGVERLEWARRMADRLAEYRNLIAHTPVTYWPRGDVMSKNFLLVPKIGGLSTKPLNVGRLEQIKSVRFWKALRNDFLNLIDYVCKQGPVMSLRLVPWQVRQSPD
jgi:hypothetical protein